MIAVRNGLGGVREYILIIFVRKVHNVHMTCALLIFFLHHGLRIVKAHMYHYSVWT